MKTMILGASALALMAATPALAQTAAPASWTGGYIGGHLGYGFQSGGKGESVVFDKNLDGAFNDTVTTAAGVNAFSPGFCGGPAVDGLAASGCRDDKNGVDFGIRAGYDRQMASGLVLGVLAEVGKAKVRDGVAAFSTTPASYTFQREIDWSAALRARAGFAMGNFLPYVTGGVARASIDHSFSSTNTVNTFVQRDDDNAWGWQLGGGVETHVSPRMIVGLEYLYSSYKDDNYTVRSQGPAPATNPFILTNASGTDLRRSDDRFDNHSVRITAAYRF